MPYLIFIALIIIILLFYILYINGYTYLNNKRALVFIASSITKGNKCEITFSSCNGYIKKVIKFKESREYSFELDCDVPKGNISVLIEDKNKERLLNLTPDNKTGLLTIDTKSRYYLTIKFEKANGKLKLRWY